MMNPVMENSELRRQILPMSLETYQVLTKMGLVERKSELIEGFVVLKASRSPLHCFIVRELEIVLESCLPSDWLVRKGHPLSLTLSEVEPDLALVLGEREDYARQHPTIAELVVEVADGCLARERFKTSIYARAGIKEYWLVNAGQQWIDLHTRPDQDDYGTRQRFFAWERLTSTVVSGLSVEISKLFNAIG